MTPPPSRRSARGGGSLIQLAPGRWRSQGIDPTGRRRSTIHHVQTKREAVELHTRFMVRLGNSELTTTRHTVNDLLDEWWTHKRPELEATSAYRYDSYLALVRRHIGNVRLDRLTPLLLDRLYRDPAVTPYTATKLSGNILHPALEQALDWGWIAANPNTRTKLPKVRAREMAAPSHAQVAALTSALLRDGPEWLGMFVHLLSVTGCRKGEVLGLRWDDIDWTAGTIRIARSVAITPATGVYVKTPKTARSTRVVTVAAGTLELLRAWGTPNTWLFPGDPAHGDLPLSPNILNKAWIAAQHAHGFTYRMHDIRHMVATHLLGNGQSARLVADVLGHARPDVTLNTYAHALPHNHQEAAALLDPGRTLN